MPRKKAAPDQQPDQLLAPQQSDLMDVVENMAQDLAMDSTQAMQAAMEFERTLLTLAHTIAAQAIRVDEGDTEAERVKAAQRQVKLIGQPFDDFQNLTQPQR